MPSLLLKSERQIQTEMLSVLIAQLGLNDINPGSVIDVLTQAAAQQDFSLYYQIAQVSRLADLAALTGQDLDIKGFEYGLTRRTAVKASGLITIRRPAGFVKVSTTFYAGFPAPVIGDTQIFVNDASNVLIGSSGTLILGRGTNNEETVSYTTAPTNFVNYYQIVLTAPLTKNHAIQETVILSQGVDLAIPSDTVVSVPATGVSEEILFVTVNSQVLLAGELEVSGVEVLASLPGSDGNVASLSMNGASAFPSPPFPGARAFNESKFTTGRDVETDDEFRDRIKGAVQSLSRGVKQAILNAIVGLVDPETAKRVVSASVVLPVEDAGAVKVYIDDGTGFEPSFAAQGFEIIRGAATGGETRLQLDQFPIAKAQIETVVAEPFDMSAGALTLTYAVGLEQETITFNPADFRFSEIATAEEVAAAINDKSALLEARTSDSGGRIIISAKRDINEDLQVLSGTANPILTFPTDRKETVALYVDDVKLSKDGSTAILDSGNIGPFNLLAIGAYPHELDLVVDGKAANPQTAVIALADVADSSAVTVAEIVAVLNRDLVGIVASAAFEGTKVRLQSLTPKSAGSKLEVTGGSANNVTNGLNFATTEVSGRNGDFTFNRELGIVELATALTPNQSVTAGSLNTRGKLRAATPELYSPASGQTLVISVDGGSNQTVTFDGSFVSGQTAVATAAFINAQLLGAQAVVRTVGGLNYIELRTNTFAPTGSIELDGTTTANAAFGFALNVASASDAPNQAFRVSAAGPFEFPEASSLVVVVDNDIVNNTFLVNLNKTAPVTTAISTTQFRLAALPTTFPLANEIVGYTLAFTTGPTTRTGVVTTVADQGGGIARYTFAPIPVGFADIAAGDLANLSGFDLSENDAQGVITAVGTDWVEISNPDALNASAQTGTGVLSQKRLVTAYNQLNGQVTVGVAFANAPTVSDVALVTPRTVQNLVAYLNNPKLTSLSLQADIQGVSGNTRIQIASKAAGSDGAIQITGGSGNAVLAFPTELFRGLAGYVYWTGLLDLVHRTIYGDDSDLVSFPGVGAAGVIFRVLAPTTKDLVLSLDVTLAEGVSIAGLENEIRSAVAGYVNNLGVGESVVLERIRSAVVQIAGITDVSISDPTANVPIAENELARIADTDILIG